MKKSILGFVVLSAMLFSSAAFSQDTVRHNSKMTTHKVTSHHHKVVKKAKPVM